MHDFIACEIHSFTIIYDVCKERLCLGFCKVSRKKQHGLSIIFNNEKNFICSLISTTPTLAFDGVVT